MGNLNAVANILCCQIVSLPMTYLGMPLRAPFKDQVGNAYIC